MSVIILGVYVLVGIVHEVSAIRFWEKARRVLKTALMPVLFIGYFTTAAPMLIVALIALLFAWIGDILLIRKDEPKFFKLGLAAFLLCHVFYITTFILMTQSLHIPAFATSICVGLVAVILVPKITDPPKAMLGPV
ncbi:MAG: lysoplasmalogenase, partial [Treponema sp.]|nr:lysoplasmalogenase [Treponema sp.]